MLVKFDAGCIPFEDLPISKQTFEDPTEDVDIRYVWDTYTGTSYGIPNEKVVVTCPRDYFPREAPAYLYDEDFMDLGLREISFVCRETTSPCGTRHQFVGNERTGFECQTDERTCKQYQWVSSVGNGNQSVMCERGAFSSLPEQNCSCFDRISISIYVRLDVN